MKKYFVVGMVFLLVFCLSGSVWAKTPTAMAQDKVLFSDPQFVADYIRALATIKGANAAKRGAKAAAISAVEQKKGAVAKKQMVAVGKEEAKYFDQRPAKQAASKEASAKDDAICKVVGMVPVVGLGMRLRADGERKAADREIMFCRNTGKTMGIDESAAGVVNVAFKLPAALPEHAVPDTLNQLIPGTEWRDLDPVTKFLVADRPYAVDAIVTGTKIFAGFTGAYPHWTGLLKKGFPSLAVDCPIQRAFLWQAAIGGGLNVVAGTADQLLNR